MCISLYFIIHRGAEAAGELFAPRRARRKRNFRRARV